MPVTKKESEAAQVRRAEVVQHMADLIGENKRRAEQMSKFFDIADNSAVHAATLMLQDSNLAKIVLTFAQLGFTECLQRAMDDLEKAEATEKGGEPNAESHQ